MIDISYLKDGVRGSIVTDVVEIAKYHSLHGGINAGWFGIPRQVLCFVDFLGSIAYNNDPRRQEDGASTRKAVRFIKEFFPKQYKPYANLLIATWRYGTVHQFVPYKYYAMKGNRKVVLEWLSNRSDEEHNRRVNMKTFNKEGHKDVIFLSVNICQLADDLLSAFDEFIKKMEKNEFFKNGCLRRLGHTLAIKNCMTLSRVSTAAKEEIRRQIFLAMDSTEGKIDQNKQVFWYDKS